MSRTITLGRTGLGLLLATALVACGGEGAVTDEAFDSGSDELETSLGGGWRTTDIGATGKAGYAWISGGTFVLKGAGTDLWGTADGFRFVFQEVDGDVTIVARLQSLAAADPYAKAGVMIRASRNAAAPFGFRGYRPSAPAMFLRRDVAAASVASAYGAAQAMPAWLKVERRGTAVLAYESADGLAWKQMGQATVQLGTRVLVGLALTSHDSATLATARFDSVKVTVAAPVGPCVGVTCSGHGRCAVSGAAAACVCEGGYEPSGLACVAIDPCAGVTCSGHGRCVASGADASCTCDAGYQADGLTCIAQPAGCTGVNPVGYGAVGDGVADDTAAFQSAANARQPMCITRPRAFYKLTQMVNLYNSVQGDGSMPEIRFANPTGAYGTSMFKVKGSLGAPLAIRGLHLNGGWDGTASGEHSHCIELDGARDVTIEANLLENPRGDGVYVGALSGTRSERITIRGNEIRNPRRCTVAVIYVYDVAITGNVLRKANNYVSALDIEPNPNGKDTAWKILIDRNGYEVPNDNAVSLYHAADWPTPAGGIGGDITVTNNFGRAAAFLNKTGTWANVVTGNNTVSLTGTIPAPLSFAAAPAPSTDPCTGVTCSAHGRCVASGTIASCSCEAGYVASGLNCVVAPTPPPASGCTGVNPLDHGALGDGVADDTAAFQRAANLKQPMCITRPPVRYRITSAVVVYDTVRGDGSMPEIRMDGPSGDWGDSMLRVTRYAGTGMVISGLHLNGGWNGSGSMEHSPCINLDGAKNVTIENNLLENPYGDGVYVGALSGYRCENIVIRKNEMRNPRRCDVAVIYAYGVSITENVLRKANDFVTAIDVEPNPNGRDTAWKVLVDKNVFDAPNAVAVMLYHAADWPYPAGGIGGDITISNNSGDASRLFSQVGTWSNVVSSGNTVN